MARRIITDGRNPRESARARDQEPLRDDVRDGDVRGEAERRHPQLARAGAARAAGKAGDRARFDLPPGTSLGRYVLLHGIGAGGMGVVYKAHDTELDRYIAIKFLRVSGGASRATARARLVREAQALAQLSHPNVITVYEVGTFRDNVFVAMELAEGHTLRDWLNDDPQKPLTEVLGVFVHAARGLAAAHDAGLIHRDFKPTNIIIGDDGRVRILDFGLARIAERDPNGSSEDALQSAHSDDAHRLGRGGSHDAHLPHGARASAAARHEANADSEPTAPNTVTRTGSEPLLSTELTEFGAVIGTPAYMAPEQHRNASAEPRSDQFAFCVTLFQALYGHKPFAGSRSDEIRRNVLAGRLAPVSREARVPRWLHKVVMRGLEIDIDKRYPSMHELVAALDRDHNRWRRHLALALALVAAAALGAALFLFQNDSEQLCQGSEEKFSEVWNPSRQAAIKSAFLNTGRGHAAATYARVSDLIRAYGERWIAARVDTCEATHKHGEQSEQMLDLRMACLERKLQRVNTLTKALSDGGDVDAADKAVRVVLTLPDVDSCSDVDALADAYQLPAGAAERAAIAAIEQALAELQTDLIMGRNQPALERAERIQRDADKTGFFPIQARARLLLASAQEANDDYQAAEESLKSGALLAAQARDDVSVANAWVDLVNLVGSAQARPEAAREFVPFARAAVARAGEPPSLQARLARSLGWLHAIAGQYDQARVQYERALEILARERGADSVQATASQLALSARYGLAGVLSNQAEYQAALDQYRRIRTIIETHFGADHPFLLNALGPIAENLSHQGELEAASAEYRRILAIDKVNRDTDNRGQSKSFRAAAMANFADNLIRQGALAEAQEMLRQALTLRLESLGTKHIHTADTMRDLSGVMARRGQLDEASEMLERARAIYQAVVGEQHLSYASWLVIDGDIATHRGQYAHAKRSYRQAIEIVDAAVEAPHPTGAQARAGLAAVARSEGRLDTALDLYAQARSDLEAIHGSQHARIGQFWLESGGVQLALEQHALAREHFEHALAIFDTSANGYRAERARALTGLAESHLGLDQADLAYPFAERAVQIWREAAQHTDGIAVESQAERAWSEFTLARATRDTGRDQQLAARLARDAQKLLRQTPQSPRQALIDNWLQQQPQR